MLGANTDTEAETWKHGAGDRAGGRPTRTMQRC